MRYWYRTDNGNLMAPVTRTPRAGHYLYERTPDLADIPGPIAACRWDGAAVVVDAARLAEVKAELRRQIEAKALTTMDDSLLSTPWGDFRVRRDDVDAYQMVAFDAIYSIQTSTAFSMTLRRDDGTSVAVTAQQFLRFMALVGQRMAARLSARDAKLSQLESATAEQLKLFVP